ncbi:alpha/beta fold hydrolase [Cellulomonas shaoxiangyii]|uniref:Alpha/beta hydrolase n=1 Tax=Cellulomonas shaoxiangyii TaxID=2566013 RepID=A0A4V1CMK6_9CELL|nr:alpha/beta hydrolase [Cellulomonas shaoxiangyii]QCB93275.1 alpha/beta hydrolase [Cellulomonas shaoxiangyii]TGY78654.1 alpha/beta hydrolase [Cellulomonas shaoxiangyii]
MGVLARHDAHVSGNADGPTLVLAHGFGCDQSMWRYVAPAFERSHRVVLFDHIGAGGSDLGSYDPKRYGRLQGYADDVVALVEAVGGPVVLVGHSVSAMVGVLAAGSRPDLFERLVLVCPSPRYVDDDGYRGGFSADEIDDLLTTMDANYLGWAQFIAPVIVGRPDRPELAQELANSFCRTDPAIGRHFARTTFLSDNREDVARVAVRTLVVQSRVDAIAPPQVGRWVHEHLQDSEMVLLDAVGHCPNLSSPEALVAVLRDFLGR